MIKSWSNLLEAHIFIYALLVSNLNSFEVFADMLYKNVMRYIYWLFFLLFVF